MTARPMNLDNDINNPLWELYDPMCLILLAQEQCPEEEWLIHSLSTCTRCIPSSIAYVYFVNPENPNQPGSEWQFERNIHLYHSKEGHIVLDILSDQRIGGVEFINKIE